MALLLVFKVNVFAQLHVTAALCENKINPLGIDLIKVRFSWEMHSKENGQYQTAYQLVIASSKEKLVSENFDVYNSFVKDSRNVLAEYKGNPLMPAQIYFWKVRVWDKNNKPAEWSNTQQFITGLFNKKDWNNAKWIGYEELPDSLRVAPGLPLPYADSLGNKCLQRPVIPLFRKTFTISKIVKKALLFVTVIPIFSVTLETPDIDDTLLNPPRPILSASAANTNRFDFSSKKGNSLLYLSCNCVSADIRKILP